jgi:hypothetical protein
MPDTPTEITTKGREIRIGGSIKGIALVLCLAGALSVSAESAVAGPSGSFARECALKEIEVITFIEQHGNAQDMAPDLLARAAFTLMDARMACREGRVSQALALYNSILRLGADDSLHAVGPVVSLPSR